MTAKNEELASHPSGPNCRTLGTLVGASEATSKKIPRGPAINRTPTRKFPMVCSMGHCFVCVFFDTYRGPD